MSHCERRNGGEDGKKKKIKKQPSPGAPEAAEGAPIPTEADRGLTPSPGRGDPGVPLCCLAGRIQQGQLLFGRDLASCVS